jgi:hypothetical protein
MARLAGASWKIKLFSLCLSDRTKKYAHVGRQGFGGLQGSEVPAGVGRFARRTPTALIQHH